MQTSAHLRAIKAISELRMKACEKAGKADGLTYGDGFMDGEIHGMSRAISALIALDEADEESRS